MQLTPVSCVFRHRFRHCQRTGLDPGQYSGTGFPDGWQLQLATVSDCAFAVRHSRHHSADLGRPPRSHRPTALETRRYKRPTTRSRFGRALQCPDRMNQGRVSAPPRATRRSKTQPRAVSSYYAADLTFQSSVLSRRSHPTAYKKWVGEVAHRAG